VPAAPAGALPVVTFDDALSLHLNGDRLVALHVEAAHTDGDLLLWWEDANVVHVGDVYYSGMYPFIDLGSGGSLAGLVAALETVLSRADSRTIVIPGHGPVSNRAELAAYRDMLVATGPARARADRRGQEPRRSARIAPDGRLRRRLRAGLDDRRALRRHPLRGPGRTPLRFSPRRRN
jgi:cyclase